MKDYYEECKKCNLLKDPKAVRLLYKSKKFIAAIVDLPLFKPHIDRKDGGHLVIIPRKHVTDRKDFTKNEANEFMLLSMLIGNTMENALPKNGIDLAIINYQDNGNWSVDSPIGPHLHLHLYGRARNSKKQKHGQALVFPPKGDSYYKTNKPLNKKDEQLLKQEINKIIKQPKYALLRKLKK
ncbi:HIT domain-containing protein [Candidatus Woesearchaeota archaeon]|nr:HIT domain-containing protein [Candidatus Woesearchaeota archaeon]